VTQGADASGRAGRGRVIALWAAIALVLGALAVVAKGRITSDLRTLLPHDEAAFTREMDFFARQGATRLMAIEATVADPGHLPEAEEALNALAQRLADAGMKPLGNADPDALPRTATAIATHLPVLVTPADLEALAPKLTVDSLTKRLDALRERASRPEDNLANMARYDILALSEGAWRELERGLGGSRISGALMINQDERHALLGVEVPFDPSETDKTEQLMELIDAAQAQAARSGVRLEGIGAYRHFRENMAAVHRDLASSLGISVVLIAILLYSLVPNVRALLVMQIPALLGMLGSMAALVATGQPVPAPILAFAAAILGVAVDAGQHVVVGIRSGHGADLKKPLMITFVTTASAFAVLLTSSVPALRCIAIMVIGGLATSLSCALFLLPRITPRLAPRDPWLRVSTPLLRLAQARPRINWLIVAVVTAVLGYHLKDVAFVHDLRKYDGSRPETWAVLNDFQERWSGDFRSSDFIVVDDQDLDRALETTDRARRLIGAPMPPIERLLPSRGEQDRRLAAWNGFWGAHADEFARNLEAACAAAHLRFVAFAPSLERYRPVLPQDAAREPLVLATWAGTPIDKLLRRHLSEVAGSWQVALPLGKLEPPELAAAEKTLAGTGAWLAVRSHIGTHLVEVAQRDIVSRGIAILAVVFLLMWAMARDWRVVAAQLLPSLLALVWTFGLLAWTGFELTPFAVLSAAFIAGIGIDSAVFLSEHPEARTLSPVLVASITTIAGVLALVNATHPMISGMGRVLAVGMSFCLLSCLLVTPSLTPYFRRTGSTPPAPPQP
jgi:predicted exporter